MSRTSNTPVLTQTEPANASTTHQIPAQDNSLDDCDLDAVVGGAMRRGPGTQTEDDVYVG